MVNVDDQQNEDRHDFTPTGERQNKDEQAAEAHCPPSSDDDDYVDVDDALYNGLDDRLTKHPDHDWSTDFKCKR